MLDRELLERIQRAKSGNPRLIFLDRVNGLGFVVKSKAPTSYFFTQIRIRFRETSFTFCKAIQCLAANELLAICRLNSTE
jgi:hypothetical protein